MEFWSGGPFFSGNIGPGDHFFQGLLVRDHFFQGILVGEPFSSGKIVRETNSFMEN